MGVIYGAMMYPEQSNVLIPTFGLPGTALDFYRAHHLVVDEYQNENPGLIDYRRCDDLAVFETEISNFDDILRFENIVRFIVLQERIDVLVPSIKYQDIKSKFSSYVRSPDTRKESALSVLQKIGAQDFLFPSERLSMQDNRVIESTLANSIYLGKGIDTVEKQLQADESQSLVLETLPSSISVPFIRHNNENKENFKFIFRDYLNSLDQQWGESTEFTVRAGYNVPLPFFANAVLSIAQNRDDIPNAVMTLRNDLEGLRKELFKYLHELNGIDSPIAQAQLQRSIKSAVQSYSKKLFAETNLFSDTVRLLVDVITKPFETATKLVNPYFRFTHDYPMLFGSSNYKRLRHYLTLDNLNTNLANFFHDSEIKNMAH